MRILTKVLRQVAVYWEPLSPDDYGQMVFNTPVEILVRWEDSTESFLSFNGNVETSRAKVYTEVDVKPLGVLWLSSKMVGYSPGSALAELVSTDDPFANLNAYEIRKFEKLPTLKATKFLRTAYL